MIWKTSDFFIMGLTAVFSLNLLIVVLLSAKKTLERNLDKRHFNYLMKWILLYMPVIVLFVTGYTLYTRTVRGIIYTDGDDITRWYIIGKRTISTTARRGNSWPFVTIMLIWGLGAVYFGVVRYLKDRRFLKMLTERSDIAQDADLCRLLTKAQSEMRIQKTITVYVNEAIPTPFVMGVFRIKLFMPRTCFSEQETELILKHELTHVRNNDYFFRRWIHYLCALLWFNPAVYRMTEFFLEINEMACDEDVLRNETKHARSVYAHLIIRMAERSLPLEHAAAITGCTENSLERRIKNIMKKSSANKKSLFLAITATAVLLCPITAVAAATGVSDFQDYAMGKFEEKNSVEVEMETEDNYVEYTEMSNESDQGEAVLRISPRGSSNIDCDISGTGEVTADTVRLSKGSKALFLIVADNSTDRFQAGLIDDDGKKTYVYSSNGEVVHTFTVQKDGDYTVFFKGTTNKNIHVSGYIVIRD